MGIREDPKKIRRIGILRKEIIRTQIMNNQPNQEFEFEEDYFTTTHNIEANEETKDLEKYYIQDAIGSTLFSKSWLLSTLSNLNTENSESTSKEEEDLESISEMSCDDQIAKYLGTEANAQFK